MAPTDLLMNKVLTNRKAFIASLGALFIGGASLFGGKREPDSPTSGVGLSAEPLPKKAIKAPRAIARGGINA